MGSFYKRTQKMPDGTLRELPTIWIKYYQNGQPVRESTGTTKETVARRILRSREGDVERGVPILPKMGLVTFEDAKDDLLNDYKVNKKKTHDDTERRIKLHLEPVFKGKRLLSITPAGIRAYVVLRQEEKAANAQINRELSVLKRMFTLAVQGGKLHAKPHIPMLQEDNVRKGFFEPEQFEAVRAHLPEPLRPVVTFAYLTGWRLNSEILPLEWRQVDWEGKTVRLDPGTTKNREGRTFPFTADLEQLLKAQLEEHDRLKKAESAEDRLSSLPPQRGAHQEPAGRLEGRQQGRWVPGQDRARFSANGRPQPRACRCVTVSGDGDGRSIRPKRSTDDTRLLTPGCCERLLQRSTVRRPARESADS